MAPASASGRRCSGVPAPRSPAGTNSDLSSGSPANAAVSCHRRCAAGRPHRTRRVHHVRGGAGRARAATSAAPAAGAIWLAAARRASTIRRWRCSRLSLIGRADVPCAIRSRLVLAPGEHQMSPAEVARREHGAARARNAQSAQRCGRIVAPMDLRAFRAPRALAHAGPPLTVPCRQMRGPPA